MKSDTERKKFHSEKLHRRKNRLHVHLSKDLRGKLKTKRRAIQVHKGDNVRILRGAHKGKEAKVSRVSIVRRRVYLEGMIIRNARAREVPVPFDPSNLMLLSLEPTQERKKIFKEDAFRKEAPKKPAPAEGKEPKAEEAAGQEKKEPSKPKSETPKPAIPKQETGTSTPDTGSRKPETPKAPQNVN